MVSYMARFASKRLEGVKLTLRGTFLMSRAIWARDGNRVRERVGKSRMRYSHVLSTGTVPLLTCSSDAAGDDGGTMLPETMMHGMGSAAVVRDRVKRVGTMMK
jgi:hypothetical protein